MSKISQSSGELQSEGAGAPKRKPRISCVYWRIQRSQRAIDTKSVTQVPVTGGINVSLFTESTSLLVAANKGAFCDRALKTILNAWAAADGSGTAGLVPNGLINDFPSFPGPDPDSMLIVRVQPETAGDIFLMSINGKFPPKPLLATSAYEGGAQLSPDKNWILYQSNETGQPEIYIRRYPAMDREWQVSKGGGVQARWSSTGREIYYRSGQQMMA